MGLESKTSQNAILNLTIKFKIVSKVYDCLLDDLFIPKLVTYGFYIKTFAFITHYLANRLQHVKIKSSLVFYLEVLRRIPQGSILRPISFDLFMSDLILFTKETVV